MDILCYSLLFAFISPLYHRERRHYLGWRRIVDTQKYTYYVKCCVSERGRVRTPRFCYCSVTFIIYVIHGTLYQIVWWRRMNLSTHKMV